jgi:hypothetical protein
MMTALAQSKKKILRGDWSGSMKAGVARARSA